MQIAQQLAEMIADAAARRERGEPAGARTDDAARLAIELAAHGEEAFDRFFELLAAKLKASGARLPPLEELPPSVAPLLAMFERSFVRDRDGELDLERTARRLDGGLRRSLGTSPRQVRRAQARAEIRRNVAASVAESLRRHGLTPACDTPEDDPE